MMTNHGNRVTQGQFSFLPDLTDAQITKQIELTCEYDWVNRTNTSGKAPISPDGFYAPFQGDLLRFQFQMNY